MKLRPVSVARGDRPLEARRDLVSRGVEISDVTEVRGVFFAQFRALDGNTWVLQELPARA